MIVSRFVSCDSGDGVKIYFEEDGVKNTLVVSADDFLASGVGKGSVTEECKSLLLDAAKRYAARRAAIRIITAGQCSKKRLYEKLRVRGFSHECAKNASDFVAAQGYIDEDWQIESYLGDLVEKRYIGRRKLIPMLLAKGYSPSAVARVIDEKYTDEDFLLYRKKFLEKTFKGKTPTAEEIKKALYKQGY